MIIKISLVLAILISIGHYKYTWILITSGLKYVYIPRWHPQTIPLDPLKSFRYKSPNTPELLLI